MRKYIRLADMSQEQAEIYRAKHKRAQAKYREKHEEYSDAEQKRNYERHSKNWGLDPSRCELTMVDGEADDEGHYNLFQTYSPSLGIHTLSRDDTWNRLGLFSCTQFMQNIGSKLRRETGKKTRFIYFAGGYDISQQLYGEMSMTEEEKAQAWHMRSRAWGAVRGPGFQPELHIASVNAGVQIGRKTGYVSFYPPEGSNRHARRVAWQDMFTLFNCGLVKAVEEYAKFWTPAQHAEMDEWLEAVKLGKDARGKWEEKGYSEKEIAERYQLPELQLMHYLARTVVDLCKEVGLYPRSLAGPAPIARALMHKYGVTSHIKPANYDTREFQEGPIMRTIKKAFFGGNIQSAITGYLPDGYHIYDVNSAHPSHIKELPCGAHGYWRDLTTFDINQTCEGNVVPHAIYHIKWRCAVDTRWGPFPVRLKNGQTRYPLSGEGWYCSPEIATFLECYDNAEYDILDGIHWVSTCTKAHPFQSMIQETYNARNAYKKVKHPAGNILKLALNSSFGVLAQTHGSHRIIDENGETTGYETPKLSNLFLAALITSGTRSDIIRLVVQDPQNVFAVATDAIKCYEPIQGLDAVEDTDKATDRQLGGLEHEHITEPAYVIMPGVIAHADGHDKYRGVPRQSIWRANGESFDNMFAAIGYALGNSLPHITAHFDEYQNPFTPGADAACFGQFVSAERELNVTPLALATKRDTLLSVQIGEHLWYCPPYKSSPDGASKSYTRPMDVGATIIERLEEWLK